MARKIGREREGQKEREKGGRIEKERHRIQHLTESSLTCMLFGFASLQSTI